MAGKTCQICGANSGIYPLCIKHLEMKAKGQVVKNEDSGKWELTDSKDTDLTSSCYVCGDETINNYKLCKECYYQKEDVVDEVSYEYNLTEAKDYYDNLKSYYFKTKSKNTELDVLIKMIAIAEIIDNEHNNKYYIDKVYKDIQEIKNKKKVYQDNKKEKIQDETPADKQTTFETEQLDYRKMYPADKHCEDGHYVRSKSEKIIDNYFTSRKITHWYETKLIDDDTGEEFYPDFYLPEILGNGKGIYIEHFGLDNENYQKKSERKIALFQKLGEEYIITTEKDINNVEDYLDRQISAIKRRYK